jgi:RNA polymerase sigma-70 factor (ECF subfamily)
MSPESHANNPVPTDAEVVARVRSGETAAFDTLFHRYHARVFNFALQMTGSRDAAEDIAQTAFVRAYNGIRRLDDGQAFLGYVFRIVVNLVRDRARQAARKPWVRLMDLWRPDSGGDSAAEPVEFADDTMDPQGALMADERQKALTRAIRQLPDEFREVVVLHHLQGMGLGEIQAATGLPAGTIKSRLGRGRQRLREALADWLEE